MFCEKNTQQTQFDSLSTIFFYIFKYAKKCSKNREINKKKKAYFLMWGIVCFTWMIIQMKFLNIFDHELPSII